MCHVIQNLEGEENIYNMNAWNSFCQQNENTSVHSGNTITALSPRTGKRSQPVVWKFVGFRESDKSQRFATCKECFDLIAAPQGKTTNLYSRLQRHHRAFWRSYEDSLKPQRVDPLVFLAKNLEPLGSRKNTIVIFYFCVRWGSMSTSLV